MERITPYSLVWFCLSVILFLCFQEKASAMETNQPVTLKELLALSPVEFENCDIARMNLLCAEGLPGAENFNVDEVSALLDQWAAHIQVETERNFHHFQEDPAYFYNSEAFYKMLIMSVVIYEDCGIRYNPKWITSPMNMMSGDHFFADSSDVFIHGMLGPKRLGTCSSMPVLYIALGRRLGYPLKLVKAKNHLFIRWDSPTEKFDMDATGKGLDRYDDEYYKQWPSPITDDEIKADDYLKSLTPQEELSVFLSIRGQCLLESKRYDEAVDCFESAYKLAPNWKGNQILLTAARNLEQNMVESKRKTGQSQN